MDPPFGNGYNYIFCCIILHYKCYRVLKRVSTYSREKNKKWAEQGAALVCLFSLGLVNKKTPDTNGTECKKQKI